MIIIQNYHKHTFHSNVFTPDSAASYEDYAKRTVELGQKILSSVEHGWQSNYWIPYEVAKQYGLKFVFGCEAYWVRDRFEKDRSNNHIIILAKNENGRQAINDILAEANISGYYYKPRVDMKLLLSLPPEDVFITSACIAFKGKDEEHIDDIILELYKHFGENFMLEIQYHNTDMQKEWNRYLLNVHNKYGIEMIVGLDSHFIFPEDSAERDYILSAKNIHYENEDGWFMDFPDEETVKNRFLEQGVFSEEQIKKAMNNSDVCLSFDDYDDNPIFNTEIKLPTLYPDKTKEEKDKIYSKLITKEFKKYIKENNIPKEDYDKYFEGVKNEVQVYKDTGMVDYPLLDYEIVKEAVKMGGLITSSGRGSAVSFFTNTLCGLSEVDRFTSPIKLYPERFISKSRILDTRSLPDIDLNVGNPEVFEKAQKIVLGENHVYPMIAFGTFKKKSAFKLYARAKNMDFELANEISNQIGKYEEALKYADDDEREDIKIEDYVQSEYLSYIEDSKPYWGIYSDKKKAPSAYLLYQGDIRKEIGLIKCKSESTKKEYITTVMDGAVAEKYKFLKNDILKVDSTLLISKVFQRIGMKPFNVNELLKRIKSDKKVWDIYAKGLTMGVNQVEKESTTKKAMKYKPSNVSELSAFIAAIRPGFKSMYKTFENREQFEYGIKSLDNILQTEELPVSFMIFQEQVMNVLNFAGFPIDQCYSIIKSIAKKHPEKVRPLKDQFLVGFSEKLQECDDMNKEEADDAAQKVWQIVNDNCNYSFNSSHAYCMALDSLYQAWQKANYPYEFYETLLQTFSDKGKKDKVSDLKWEMNFGFGIKEGNYRWGLDNRKFIADKEHNAINPSLLSIKGLSQGCANDLYTLSQKEKFNDYYSLWKELKKKRSLNSAKINTLIKIGYFDDFATIGKIQKFMDGIEALYERSQFSKSELPQEYKNLIIKYSDETEKTYKNFQYDNALKELWESIPEKELSIKEKLDIEKECFGYLKFTVPELSQDYYYVQQYECKFKNPKLQLYRICDGQISTVKVKRAKYDMCPINDGDIIEAVEKTKEGKWSKDNNGEWQQNKYDKEVILKKWNIVR